MDRPRKAVRAVAPVVAVVIGSLGVGLAASDFTLAGARSPEVPSSPAVPISCSASWRQVVSPPERDRRPEVADAASGAIEIVVRNVQPTSEQVGRWRAATAGLAVVVALLTSALGAALSRRR